VQGEAQSGAPAAQIGAVRHTDAVVRSPGQPLSHPFETGLRGTALAVPVSSFTPEIEAGWFA
jgi:hypothetical protein